MASFSSFLDEKKTYHILIVCLYLHVLAAGHFAERHFTERHFAERHFAARTFCRTTLFRTNILSNGQFDERTFRRKDILPKRQLAENREILGVVTRTDYDWPLNKSSQSYNQFINLITETLIVK